MQQIPLSTAKKEDESEIYKQMGTLHNKVDVCWMCVCWSGFQTGVQTNYQKALPMHKYAE